MQTLMPDVAILCTLCVRTLIKSALIASFNRKTSRSKSRCGISTHLIV